MNSIERLPSAIRQLLVEPILEIKNFVGLNPDITGLATGATQGLVNHDPGMLKAAALPFGSSAEQKRSHAGGQTNANGVHIGFDVLHRVKDAETVVNGTAG